MKIHSVMTLVGLVIILALPAFAQQKVTISDPNYQA